MTYVIENNCKKLLTLAKAFDIFLSMNIAKNVRRNLSRPYAQRIATSVIIHRAESGVAVMRGNSLGLLATIHEEIKNQLASLHEASLALENVKRYE